MKRFRLSRRTLLQGTGAAVGLPLLEVMLNSHGTALAQGQPLPKRLITWFWGNGVINSRWKPAATGGTWALSEELAPLAKVKSYVNVVSGYNIKIPNARGHHCGVAGVLSGYPFIALPAGSAPYASKFGGPSIDQVAAGIIGKDTTFASVQVAISKRVTTGEGPTLRYISHKGPDAPLPAVFSPAALFNTLFANVATAPTTDPRNSLRANVLDLVKDDVNRLKTRLGAADKARLDAHLTSISEVRQQIVAMPPPTTTTCVKPAAVTDTNADVSGKERLKEVNKAMSDLLAIAFACDLTRVASVQFSGSVGHFSFPDLGLADSQHSMTHEATRQDDVHRTVVFTMECAAYFLEKLMATADGTTNVLRNSVVLMSSDVTEGLNHGINDYPILVAGGGGGFLKNPGIHLRGSGNNTSDVLLTCLQAAGTGVTSVGQDGGRSTTPATALHA